MTDLALDTSVAVPYVLRSHERHQLARRHVGQRRPTLTAHSLAETYSVLTRLPGDARVAPVDAAALLNANFGVPVSLDLDTAASIPAVLAPVGVAGGAVYDALVGLAAHQAGLPLATRDKRAATTYAALDVEIELFAALTDVAFQ